MAQDPRHVLLWRAGARRRLPHLRPEVARVTDITPERISELRALAEERDALRAEVERLRDVAEVAGEILDRWEAQEARSVAWQRLASRARAATSDEERAAIKAEGRALDSTRVVAFDDLRVKLGKALGR